VGVNDEKKIIDWKEKLKLYVITDAGLSRGRNNREVVEAALRGGATAVQLREKNLPTRRLLEEARELRRLTLREGALFIVNDRPDVALAVEADGVHIGDDDMPLQDCRRILGDSFLVGVSADSPEEAKEAQKQGADYLGCGPVYATTTKTDAGVPLGPGGLEEICRSVEVPVVGIGGIDVENAAAVMEAGVFGIAVISAVVSANSPEEACLNLRKEIGES